MVTRVSITTSLAAAEIGLLVLSEFSDACIPMRLLTMEFSSVLMLAVNKASVGSSSARHHMLHVLQVGRSTELR